MLADHQEFLAPELWNVVAGVRNARKEGNFGCASDFDEA
jgi:hypothetical protein